MTHYLDPKRNLIAQLAVLCAGDGDHYMGSEFQEQSNDKDHRIRISDDETEEGGRSCLSDPEVVYLRKELQQATLQPSPNGSTVENSDSSSPTFKVVLSSPQTQYLKQKGDLQKLLKRKLEDQGFRAEFNSELSEVRVDSNESHLWTSVQKIVSDVVGVVDMEISRQLLCMMPDIHARDILKEDEQVMVIVDRERDSFKLVGPTSIVEVIGQRLSKGKQIILRQSLGKEDDGVYSSYLSDSESIKLTESCFNYLKKHRWEEMSKLNETYEYLCVEAVEEGDTYVILVEGPIEAVSGAAASIKDIVGQLKTTQFRLLSRSEGGNGVPELTPDIEENRRCVIKFISDDSDIASIKYPGDEKIRIQSFQADVIVNTTNTKLDLQTGWGLSAVLAKAGGPGIEKELKLLYPDGIAHGEVAVSSPGKLTNCKAIYHGALPPFKQEGDYSYRMLVQFMINCLERANSAGHKSIAFPGLGTGVLQYPLHNVVQLMNQTVMRFLESMVSVYLEEILFVIYPSANPPIKQTFIMENISTRMKSLIVDDIHSLHEELQTRDRMCCEARLPVHMYVRNHIQVFNSDVTSVCDVTKNVLILWRRKDLTENNGNPILAFLAPTINEHFNMDLVFGRKDTKCVLDKNTIPEYTLIHSVYMDVEATERGLKMARKENILSLTIPISEDGSNAWYPSNAANIVLDAVKKFNSSEICISIVIPNSRTFRNFVVMAMETNGRSLQTPQDTKGIVESVWASQKSVLPGDMVIFVTSESEVINQDAAEDLARQLNMQIVYTVFDYNMLIST